MEPDQGRRLNNTCRVTAVSALSYDVDRWPAIICIKDLNTGMGILASSPVARASFAEARDPVNSRELDGLSCFTGA